MHSSIVILSKGTDGGTGTLSIRISEWCKANDVKMGYASVRNTNSLNTNSMKNNQVTIEFDDDLTYHTQYKRLLLCENTLILTYTLLDYYYAELLQKQYEQIKKIILYQVGFGSIPYETKHEHRRIPKPIAVCTFIIATLAMLIISCLKEESPWMLVVVWAPLSTAAVYIFALSEDFPKSFRRLLFENKALEWIGNISFELFLIHQLVIRYWNSIMLAITAKRLTLSCTTV